MLKSEIITVLIFLGCFSLIYGVECVHLLKYLAAKLHRRPWRENWKTLLFHFLGLFGLACFIYSYAVEPYWLDVTTIRIETEKLQHTRLRIVQFSDTHCDKKPRIEEQVVECINALQPDVIVFTGDCLNTPEALPRFQSMLSRLDAAIGKYAVFGNNDTWYRCKIDMFEGTGFTVLNQESVQITKDGEHFRVAGLDCEHPEEYREVLAPLIHQSYNIFLYHYPDLIEDITDFPVDLYLAGHTHGGQVALPFYGALVTLSEYGKEYESGKYQVGTTTLYVNRGIGMEGGPVPRVRFWARPEITVFEVMPK
jgi:predicted MPP superfamily phosphohydrolase